MGLAATAEAPAPVYMTVEELAQYLRISRTKAYAMAAGGDLPTIRLGKSVRIRRDRLESWLEQQSRA